VAIPGAVYRGIHAANRTTVDLGIKVGSSKILAANFIKLARQHLAK
jgi:hypothetical protein